MRGAFFCCLILLFTSHAFGQTKLVKSKIRNGLFYYRYQVLKKDPDIKEGSFKGYYNGLLYIYGSYHNNQKEGKWIYRNVEDAISYEGTYKDGLPSGQWKYYYHRKLYSLISYNEKGAINGEALAFDEQGDTIAFQHFIDGKHDGLARFYYSNHQLKQKILYHNGQRTYRESYFKNGQVNIKIVYKNDQPYNVLSSLDEKGDSLPFGDFKNGNGYLMQYYPGTTVIISNGHYKNGLRNGAFAFYFEDGQPAFSGKYDYGLKKGVWKFYAHDNIKPHVEHMDELIVNTDDFPSNSNLDIIPQFVGGINGLMSFLNAQIKYPEEARKKQEQGSVIVHFIIGKNGSIKDPEITQSISSSLDQEAISIVRNLPNWSPGMKDFIPTKAYFNLPIRFQL